MKSIALFLGAVIFSAVSTSTFAEDQKRVAHSPEQYGRYVITYSPYVRADTFLIDTQTGKVWQQTQITDVVGEPVVWKYVDRIDNEAQNIEWLSHQRVKQPPQ